MPRREPGIAQGVFGIGHLNVADGAGGFGVVPGEGDLKLSLIGWRFLPGFYGGVTRRRR